MNDSYGKWIPVSERLPEKNNRPFYPMCLVTTKEGHICLCVYRKDNKEWWTRFSEGETCYSTQHDVQPGCHYRSRTRKARYGNDRE